ncbi:MAG: exodeoxyribonuclease VII small subunit [candidate division NC10 bacterium]|nr:exodeoxyribonuclease VII small subunit [candidate division NC10 bacterium]
MEEVSFEEALGRLEAIVNRLEEGNLLLEEALQAFEEGVHWARVCSKRLEEGEKKVSLLLRTAEGDLVERPFEETEEEDTP